MSKVAECIMQRERPSGRARVPGVNSNSGVQIRAAGGKNPGGLLHFKQPGLIEAWRPCDSTPPPPGAPHNFSNFPQAPRRKLLRCLKGPVSSVANGRRHVHVRLASTPPIGSGSMRFSIRSGSQTGGTAWACCVNQSERLLWISTPL